MKKLILLSILLQACTDTITPNMYHHAEERCKNNGGLAQIIKVDNWEPNSYESKSYTISFICVDGLEATDIPNE